MPPVFHSVKSENPTHLRQLNYSSNRNGWLTDYRKWVNGIERPGKAVDIYCRFRQTDPDTFGFE